MYQTLKALSYMHQKKVVHRDLKCENIMVAEATGTEDAYVKLIDFGFAKITESNELLSE